MKLFDYTITNLEDYPDDGNHQQCNVHKSFCIRKGEDGYTYINKDGVKKKYNMRYNKKNNLVSTKNWICHLTEDASESLREIFDVRESKSLDVILKYCTRLYIKSLKLEIKHMKEELKQFK